MDLWQSPFFFFLFFFYQFCGVVKLFLIWDFFVVAYVTIYRPPLFFSSSDIIVQLLIAVIIIIIIIIVVIIIIITCLLSDLFVFLFTSMFLILSCNSLIAGSRMRRSRSARLMMSNCRHMRTEIKAKKHTNKQRKLPQYPVTWPCCKESVGLHNVMT